MWCERVSILRVSTHLYSPVAPAHSRAAESKGRAPSCMTIYVRAQRWQAQRYARAGRPTQARLLDQLFCRGEAAGPGVFRAVRFRRRVEGARGGHQRRDQSVPPFQQALLLRSVPLALLLRIYSCQYPGWVNGDIAKLPVVHRLASRGIGVSWINGTKFEPGGVVLHVAANAPVLQVMQR